MICQIYKKELGKGNMHLTIPKRVDGSIVHQRVCGTCYHNFYSEGEK